MVCTEGFILHCYNEKDVCLGVGEYCKKYIFHQAKYLSKTSLEAVNFPGNSKESCKLQ